MKIRDLQTYLEGYCPTADISQLGTDKEPFLKTIYGIGQEIDSTIRDVASFAKDSQEQLFYEFVQNAFDAKADSLCFFFDEEYLIVLNNGDPFYTDKWEEGSRPRDGQLYNFLAKGKSLKSGDEAKSGEFGQGSKLLYTLISDKGAASNKSLLIKSIKQEKKGPYLFSWGDIDQLNVFRLQSSDEWILTDPYSDKPDLLLCKILMTYYPITPGIDPEYFSLSEFDSIRSAFERLVDPKRNINRLKKGTAIIIPLGHGQYEAIADEGNLNKVMNRLAGFAALTADKEKNKGRRLDHIYVNGREVEMQHTVQSLFVQFTLPDIEEQFNYQFAFNPIFVKDSAVTLFKTLPITEARYNMGFIIDSANFEHDSSRQRINDTRKTGLQLAEAFPRLLAAVKALRASSPDQFDYIYDAILSSRPSKKDEDVSFISNPFYNTFKPYFQQNVKTVVGTYLPMSQVRKPDELTRGIPLLELGITDCQWISDEIAKKEIDRFGIEVSALPLDEILHAAKPSKLSDWISSLSKEEYKQFHEAFLKLCQEDDSFPDMALFKSNRGNIYSLNTIRSAENPVILYDESHSHLDRCTDVEYILEPIKFASDDDTENNGTINVGKLAKQIAFYRDNDARVDVACHILVDAYRYPRARAAITEKIALFANLDGEYHTFHELLFSKPKNTILFDGFCAAGYVPSIKGVDNLFYAKQNGLWTWLVEKFEDLTSLPDWEENHDAYLKDIISVYKAAENPEERLSLSLDDNGIPVNDKTFLLRNDDRIDSEQYELIGMFAETKGYSLIPYRFRKILSEAPFESEQASIVDIIGEKASVDAHLLGCIVKLAGNTILRSFKVTPQDDDKYLIIKGGGKNYTCAIQSDTLDKALVTIGYCRIAPEVARYFDSSQLTEFELATNHEMMANVVAQLGRDLLPDILPVVKAHNATIVRSYFDRLPDLIIDEPVDENNSAWQVISFAISRIGNDSYYRTRLLQLISHNEQRLPDSIKSDIVRFNGTDYDLYKLLGDVKVENELVDSFLGCIPDPQLFKKAVYANNEESQSADDVYEQLYETYLSVEQLRFCLDYSITNDEDYDNLEIEEDVPLSDALNMISQYNFTGFDQYFSIAGFDKDKQAFAPENLLLPEEKLPKDLYDWIARDKEKALSLLKGLKTENDDYIALRSALLDGRPFANIDGVVYDEDHLDRTVGWIISQKFQIGLSYGDIRFIILSSLLDRLPDDLDTVPGLRLTSQFKTDETSVYVQQLSFEEVADEASFMTYGNALINAQVIKQKQKLLQFFSDKYVYGYNDAAVLLKQQGDDCIRYEIRTTAEKRDHNEWNTTLYKQWTDSKDSEGVRIFLSKDPVSIHLYVTNLDTQEHVVGISSRNNVFGYDENDRTVIIQHPNPEGITEMKTLEKAAKSASFFKDPFISLQSLFVELYEAGIDPNALNENEKKGADIANQLGTDTVNKLEENLDTVKDILDGLTKEELKTVAENKDKIQNLLEDMPNDEDEPQSKVRQTIGYLGELIYKNYLDKKSISYRHASQEGVGDYDFELLGEDGNPTAYVDVKTNLYSFVDGAVPFYIHKSQNRFMQLHPDEPFRIVRISLTDINLKRAYEHIRDYFGREEDVELNDELKEYCKRIARNYWRSARFEEFDAASPEYGIKIVRL